MDDKQTPKSRDGGKRVSSPRIDAVSLLAQRVDRVLARPGFGWIMAAAYAALLVCLGLVLHTSGDAASESDFFGPYVKQARHFLAGAIVVDPFRGPIYPMALGLASVVLSRFGAGLFETGIILSSLSAGVVIALLYRIVARLYSPRHAFVAAVLMAFNPVFVRYSYTAGNDMFFVAFAFAAMALFLSMTEPSWYGMVGAGAITSIAYLTRYTGVALFLGIAIATLVVNMWRIGWKHRLVALVVFVAAACAVVTPWALYCKKATGHFVYNRNYMNLALGVYSTDGDSDRFQVENPGAFESFADVVAHDPVRFLRAVPERAVRQAHTGVLRVMTFPAAALAFLGVLFMLLRPPTRRQTAFYIFGVAYFAVIFLVFFSDRFMLFLVPFAGALAASGLFRLDGSAPSAARGRSVAVVVFVAVALYGAGITVFYNNAFVRGETQNLKALGQQFSESVPPDRRGTRVVARMPHFAYYAGLEHIRLPVVDSEEELVTYMRRSDADYLFFSLTAQRTRGEIAALINPRASHPGLRVVAASPIGVLYEIDERPARDD